MKAVLVGATGLVGSEILKLLIKDTRFSEVRVFSRRSTGISDPKLIERVIDFDKPSSWESDLIGDVLFIALGTTLKDAGSKEAQYRVDHDYPLHIAKIAHANGLRRLILISSAGADHHSSFFYLRTKGELEEDIKDLKFESTFFIRPGPLEGIRERPRLKERISLFILNLLPKIRGSQSLWPVRASTIAHVALEEAFNPQKGVFVLEPREIFSFHHKNTY